MTRAASIVALEYSLNISASSPNARNVRPSSLVGSHPAAVIAARQI